MDKVLPKDGENGQSAKKRMRAEFKALGLSKEEADKKTEEVYQAYVLSKYDKTKQKKEVKKEEPKVEVKKEEPKSVSVETGVQTETEKPKINYVLFQRDYSRAHKKDNKPVPKKEIEDAFKKAGGTIKEKPQCSTESNAVTKNLKKNIAKLAEGGEVIITYKKK